MIILGDIARIHDKTCAVRDSTDHPILRANRLYIGVRWESG